MDPTLAGGFLFQGPQPWGNLLSSLPFGAREQEKMLELSKAGASPINSAGARSGPLVQGLWWTCWPGDFSMAPLQAPLGVSSLPPAGEAGPASLPPVRGAPSRVDPSPHLTPQALPGRLPFQPLSLGRLSSSCDCESPRPMLRAALQIRAPAGPRALAEAARSPRERPPSTHAPPPSLGISGLSLNATGSPDSGTLLSLSHFPFFPCTRFVIKKSR